MAVAAHGSYFVYVHRDNQASLARTRRTRQSPITTNTQQRLRQLCALRESAQTSRRDSPTPRTACCEYPWLHCTHTLHGKKHGSAHGAQSARERTRVRC